MITNKTFDEIQIGAAPCVRRRIEDKLKGPSLMVP